MDFYIFLKPNINALDYILPIIFELKKARYVGKSVFIVYAQTTVELLKKNPVLFGGINDVGGELVCLSRFNNSFLNLLYKIFVLRKFFYKKIVTIETGGLNTGLISRLRNINKRYWRGERISLMMDISPLRIFKKNIEYQKLTWGDNQPESKPIDLRGYTRNLLKFEVADFEDAFKEKILIDAPAIVTGYVRGLPAWQGYLAQQSVRFLPPACLQKPYIFFVLSNTSNIVDITHVASSEVIVQECLSILSEFSKDIYTVLKSSRKSEIGKVQKMLDALNYQNYSFSDAHPMILAKNAKFTFSYASSSVLLDAYWLGCPTVEYAIHNEQTLAQLGGQTAPQEFVDFLVTNRDTDALRNLLKDIIYHDINVCRDSQKIIKDFPILSPSDIAREFSFLRK